jgi:hypothetical protein
MSKRGLLSRFAGGRTKAAILAIVAVILIVVFHSLWLPSAGGFLISVSRSRKLTPSWH